LGLGVFLASNWPRRWHFSPLDDFSAFDSVSLLVRYLFGNVTATPDVGGANPIVGTGGQRNIQLGLKFLF
jgi:hypothetical protein